MAHYNPSKLTSRDIPLPMESCELARHYPVMVTIQLIFFSVWQIFHLLNHIFAQVILMMFVHLCRKVIYGLDVSYRICVYILGTLMISVVSDYKTPTQNR